jgi:2-oxoglutarate ferredoxin oxidoreductase subunit beta
LGAEATFVARSIDFNTKHLGATLLRAAQHKGTSFVEVFQNCNVFNDGAWSYVTDRETKDDHTLVLEHGQPMVFGKDRDKGIRLNGLMPEIVSLNETNVDDLLFHNEEADSPHVAFTLSRMSYPDYPVPIGVFRAVQRPTYERQVGDQIAHVKAQKGDGDLQKLFGAGETWTVSE